MMWSKATAFSAMVPGKQCKRSVKAIERAGSIGCSIGCSISARYCASGEYCHKPVDGEAAEICIADALEIRRGDADQFLRGAHGELAVVEHPDDTRRRKRAQLLATASGWPRSRKTFPLSRMKSKSSLLISASAHPPVPTAAVSPAP